MGLTGTGDGLNRRSKRQRERERGNGETNRIVCRVLMEGAQRRFLRDRLDSLSLSLSLSL